MTRIAATVFLGVLMTMQIACAAEPASTTLNVGSKRFTESYVLAEIITQTSRGARDTAIHRQGLGNTAIVLNALESGNIDIYPEYTGTIAREILKLDHVPPLAELNTRLAPLGLAAAVPLGFNNTYALAMPETLAKAHNISRLSDLKAHSQLKLGLSQEFIGRADGWRGLRHAYALPFAMPRGLDHGLAYEAIAQGQVNVIDIYSTDAKIGKYQLTVLDDDAHYFPRYDAVLLYKADLPARFPRTWAALTKLEGRIDEAAMRGMNAAAELEQKSFDLVAHDFIKKQQTAPVLDRPVTDRADREAQPKADAAEAATFTDKLFGPDLGRLAMEHLALVFLSLAASVIVGLPLGILAARHRIAEAIILGVTGVLQTIPSLALLAILIPVTGKIGIVPAFIALALYALLPIVRNTHSGLTQISHGLKQAAQSLGMTPRMVLTQVELPLARPTIFAGIKTSAVINVGTATIAAFIGAGGFGERIVTGLALNDNATLLAGAIPVALLALMIEGAFNWGERRMIPAALRARDEDRRGDSRPL